MANTRISFSLTREEYAASFAAWAARVQERRGSRGHYVVDMTILYGGSAITAIVLILIYPSSTFPLLLLLLGGALSSYVLGLIQQSRMRGQLAANYHPRIHHNLILEVTGQGLVLEGETHSHLWTWELVTRIHSIAEHLVVEIPGFAVMVPNRAFATEASRYAFLRELTERSGAAVE